MQNRQQETYRRAFTVMHENLEGIVPLSVMTDFEIAAINGFREVFGAAIPLRNCLFHLGQAVNRKLMNDGFAQIYGQNAEFKKAIRSLVALSFLQIDEVLDGYDTLRANSPQEALPIFDYFQNTYLYRVVNGERQAPLFSHYNWNMHDATVENLHRTNNAMEGWHCSFAKRFRGVHPALSKFINGIKEEEEYQRNRIRPFELDPTRGLTETRKKKYVENDRAIKNLILRYDNDENRNDETLLGHLRALQYRLADTVEIQD